MGRWKFPHTISSQEGTGKVTIRTIPELGVVDEESDQDGVVSQKMGGKLKYIKTL
jgi:hypothetical protein